MVPNASTRVRDAEGRARLTGWLCVVGVEEDAKVQRCKDAKPMRGG